MEKFTPQIAALYLGQKCQTKYGDGFIDGVFSSGKITVQHPQSMSILPADEIKPVLRRLDSLTESEARELTGKKNDALKIWNGWQTGPRADYDQEQIGEPSAWLKLLSWGFDLFGLIDSGLAIDAETIKEETKQ